MCPCKIATKVYKKPMKFSAVSAIIKYINLWERNDKTLIMINGFMRAALKALSYPDLDTKKNYKTERKMVNAAHHHVLRPFYKIWDHKVSAPDHDIPVRIFSPRLGGTFPVLLFFHGGGWVTGNIDSYDRTCTDMAELSQQVVVSVDYRLAPEHRFPAALEDCYLVAKDVFLHADLFDITAEQITLIGDSAGGNLAAAVSLMARDRGEFSPKQQILLYPATYNDHSPTSPFASILTNGDGYLLTTKRLNGYMDLYMSSQEDLQNPYFAPLISEDLSCQPRTLILTAEYDPLRDEGEAYGKKLRDFGNAVEIHRLPDALHGFISLKKNFPHVKMAYRYINSFLNSQCKRSDNCE